MKCNALNEGCFRETMDLLCRFELKKVIGFALINRIQNCQGMFSTLAISSNCQSLLIVIE